MDRGGGHTTQGGQEILKPPKTTSQASESCSRRRHTQNLLPPRSKKELGALTQSQPPRTRLSAAPTQTHPFPTVFLHQSASVLTKRREAYNLFFLMNTAQQQSLNEQSPGGDGDTNDPAPSLSVLKGHGSLHVGK